MARFTAPVKLKDALLADDPRAERPWQVVVQLIRNAIRHRTTGHAAEMAFFAVLTLVPSTVAVGSALGLSERVIGATAVADAETAITQAVRALIGPELTDTIIAPFVHAQLAQPKGGVALGGLLVAWWLSSHLFAATGNALDQTYGVLNRRANVARRFIALGFALGSVVVVSISVELMVHGPLGRGGGQVARELGMAGAYTVGWSILRWPLLFAIVVTFLACLYRFSPSLRLTWRECLPGAALGAGLWVIAAVAFRVMTAVGLRGSSGVAADDPVVQIIGQSVNAVVATVIWAYLASIAILVGAEFNALLRERREAHRQATVGFPFV